jgi:lambda repressor-like predicted transcriptional regulator
MAELDWNLQALAYHADMHENGLRKTLAGESFKSETLAKLAHALGVHPIDLIEAEGFGDPHMDAPAIPVHLTIPN